MVAEVPTEAKLGMDLSFAIADRIDALIKKKGLTKKNLQIQSVNVRVR